MSSAAGAAAPACLPWAAAGAALRLPARCLHLATPCPCPLCCSTLEKVQPRAVSYEEQVSAIREQLAALYEGQEEWSKAAQALAGIDLDSGMRLLDAGGPGWHGLGLSGGAALGGAGLTEAGRRRLLSRMRA